MYRLSSLCDDYDDNDEVDDNDGSNFGDKNDD